MKHRITFLTAIMLLGMTSAFAQGGTAGPLTWNISGGTLTISGNGAMPDYNIQGGEKSPWYPYRESINTVIIQNGVTRIGAGAFRAYNNPDYNDAYVLSSVTIPSSITIWKILTSWLFRIAQA